jgi:hypothetical protein
MLKVAAVVVAGSWDITGKLCQAFRLNLLLSRRGLEWLAIEGESPVCEK